MKQQCSPQGDVWWGPLRQKNIAATIKKTLTWVTFRYVKKVKLLYLISVKYNLFLTINKKTVLAKHRHKTRQI